MAFLAIINSTFYQQGNGSNISSNGNYNLKHSFIIFVAAKIYRACAKPLRK